MATDENDVVDGAKAEVLDASTAETAEMAEGLGETDIVATDGSDDEPPLFERRDNANRHKRAVFGVPIQVVIAVGRATPSIGELMTMRRDTLLRLDAKIDDPVDIMIGKRVIARGELQELDDEEGRLGVRLTEIVDLAEPF